YGGFHNATVSGNLVTDEATSTIAKGQRTSNFVTITTTSAHDYKVGYTVAISGTPGGIFDGTRTVASVTDATTFTFSSPGADSGVETGGTAYSAGSGFTQAVGIFVLNSDNSKFLHNDVRNNHMRNVDLESGTNVVFQSDSNFPGPSATDLYVAVTPSLSGITVRIPDIQTTITSCTTAAAPAAICSNTISHFLGSSPLQTQCTLDSNPVAHTGLPLILNIVTSNINQSSVVVGTLDGNAAGG